MATKAIYEVDAKRLISEHFPEATVSGKALENRFKAVQITKNTNQSLITQQYPWLQSESLIAKPDQLIKRRGKLGLITINKKFEEASGWVNERLEKPFTIGSTVGNLKSFIVEPFVPHEDKHELYLAIFSNRTGDEILFYHQGGVDVGDVDAKASKLQIDINGNCEHETVKTELLQKLPDSDKELVADLIVQLFTLYRKLYFAYLEINPFVLKDNKIYILDVAAKLDQTAEHMCSRQWGKIDFPSPFGRDNFPEEQYIQELDARSGASLKLTILNENGRIWTMVAGGGASVVYADAICALGGSEELANYGEYSGAPSEQQTYDYARTILGLMTKGEARDDGKLLIVGGGIANFTNVAATFKGIVTALREFQNKILVHKIKIFVRRAGPNYQEGLRIMREVGIELGIPLYVYGPETHMTAICGMAMGKTPIPEVGELKSEGTNFLLSTAGAPAQKTTGLSGANTPKTRSDSSVKSSLRSELLPFSKKLPLFHRKTKSVVYGLQTKAVQGMLDFDFSCSREMPSVCAMVYPFSGDHRQKFYWGHKEILIPVYTKMDDCCRKHPDADVLINFASLRSAEDATLETLKHAQFRTIAIIAEGIPEFNTRKMNAQAKKQGVTIIGPATVGGIKPGCFKIGNTGGMLDNILSSKLYRPGSVAYVSRSGGMSNELNNIISRNTDGVYEGVAIGGDRYPGTVFMDHIMRYEQDENAKMIVVLGEVGGIEEYDICEAIKSGQITKPLVAWCIGTCGSMFKSEVQFGHAGACANSDKETSVAKNEELKISGAFVPESFDHLPEMIKQIYLQEVESGNIIPKPEVPPPTVPMDYNWAKELGLIRKPATFMTSITDERGQELIYAGMKISKIFEENIGIGGVLGLLWFQKRLPEYASKFIEMCLIVTADHGPAVSGAHNTIVCARAGKDLVSSLTSGLLTIGPRFGGALDGAAQMFTEAYDKGLLPHEFVTESKKSKKLIMGIGHRIKSINNPDKRVEIIKNYVLEKFPQCPVLKYALEVEKVTTSKKPNLILNVDGCIAVCFVDLLRSCGSFTRQEGDEYIANGCLNALFVLGRSMGFIGHYLDQKRLKQGLYRHPWDDISYVLPEAEETGAATGAEQH